MDKNEELVLRMEAAARDSKNSLGKMKAEKRRKETGEAIKGLGKVFPKGIRPFDSLVKNPGAILPKRSTALNLFPGFKGVDAVTPVVKAPKYGLPSGTFVPGSRLSTRTGTNNRQSAKPVKYKLL